MTFGIILGAFGVLVVAELAAGIGYNAYIGRLVCRGRLEGYDGFAVAGGVSLVVFIAYLVALAVVAVSGRVEALPYLGISALWIFLAFCGAGAPMIWGSVTRYWQKREHGERMLADLETYRLDRGWREGDDGDETERVAERR